MKRQNRYLEGTQEFARKAAPVKPCECGEMYLPAPVIDKDMGDQRNAEAEKEAQGKGGNDNKSHGDDR